MSLAPLRVLIAGGGVAALEALLALRDLAEDRVAIDLLSAQEEFVYRPLEVGAPFALGKTRRYALAEIAQARGARFHRDALARIDVDRRVAFTASGEEHSYDALLVAVGARAVEAVPGALTYASARDAPAFRRLLTDIEQGRARRILFVLPTGFAWPLPLYELALLTGRHARERGANCELAIVTPEEAPLAIFGRAAAAEARALLDGAGVELHGSTHPSRFDGEMLLLDPGRDPIPADRVVALPRLTGRRIGGLPAAIDGFVRVDPHCRVAGAEGVWAAGDVIDFPVKQGGLAAQQADAAAQDIAARAGAPVEPERFRPVLRGILLTGEAPRYLRATIASGAGEDSVAADHALWWPPGKIAGRYLAPYLGAAHEDIIPHGVPGAIPLEVALEHEWSAAHPHPPAVSLLPPPGPVRGR